MRRFLFQIVLFSSLHCTAAELSVAPVFTDHMVLQRERPVPVWGTADAGTTVTVEFAGQRESAVTDSSNHWKIMLDPMPAFSKPRTLTVRSSIGNQQSEIGNVLVGDVWLCSGQSNMEWPLARTEGAPAVMTSADHSGLRLFTTSRSFAAEPQEKIGGRWEVCSSQSAASFSAAAYYFGRQLHEDLDVPIGLLVSAWGGAMIEPWIPGLDGEGTDRQSPSVLYNGMIHPHIPFAIRGVIWYQGESDRYDGMTYTDKARALIEGWRTLWGYDFPFYLVQIAPFQYKIEDPSILPAFWEAQTAIAKTIPKTGTVIINDCATLDNIHPPHKETVGMRLARLAEANEYGLNVVSSGPVFQRLEKDGTSLRIRFDSADGLTTRDGLPPDWFELAGADGLFKNASARIEGSSVVLHCDEVPDPVAVQFAWHKTAVPNLVNGAGWPAGAFRTGDILRPPKGVVPLPEAAGFRILVQVNLPEDPSKKEIQYVIDRCRTDREPFSRVALCMELELKNSGSKQYVFVALDPFTNDLTKYSLQQLAGQVLQSRNMVIRSNVEEAGALADLNPGTVQLLPDSLGIDIGGKLFGDDGKVCRFRRLTILVK